MIPFDKTVLFILATTGLLGICAGILGSFLFLQRKSLFADTIAHATLPGITGFFLLTYNKDPWFLLCAGIFSSIIATYIIYFLQHQTTLKNDTILGIVLSTSFGLGTVFLSKIQIVANSHQAGLSKYLLGNASTLLHQDLYQVGTTTLLTIIIVSVFFHHCSIMLFDNQQTTSHQPLLTFLYHTITLLTTITIVIGLQTVGVILISALLIIPACIAQQWCKSLRSFIIFSAFIGLLCTSIGTLISSLIDHVPTGPAIIAVAASMLLITLLCTHKRVSAL
jgi:manganese/zinc/iron transport system permease protein